MTASQARDGGDRLTCKKFAPISGRAGAVELFNELFGDGFLMFCSLKELQNGGYEGMVHAV